MFEIKFNTKMRTAWLLLSLNMLIQSYFRLMNPDEPIATRLVLVGICLLNPGILVFLIRALRGPNRDWRDRTEGAAQLSTWGYFWRAYIVYFSQIPIFLLTKLVLPFDVQANHFSAFEYAAWEIPFVLGAMLSTWLLFSRDRRGQATVLIASLGY